jgi:ribosome maturation factor RimP
MPDHIHLVTKRVIDLVEGILDEMGFELVDVAYLPEHGRWVLRLYIDKEGGVTIGDCALVSREMGDLIDVKDIIEHEYILEVSSPGLNRPLRKETDIIRVIGKKIKVRTAIPVKGRRNFSGFLKDYRDGTLYLELDDNLVALSWPDVEKANLIYEFEH